MSDTAARFVWKLARRHWWGSPVPADELIPGLRLQHDRRRVSPWTREGYERRIPESEQKQHLAVHVEELVQFSAEC
jgi:hypothetical protein